MQDYEHSKKETLPTILTQKSNNNNNNSSNAFSFGKNNEKSSNPFENYLYQSTKTDINRHSSPTRIMSMMPEVLEETSNKKDQENLKESYGKNTMIFDKKPPLSKNSSLKNLKQMENSMKNNSEFERIANIMNGNFIDQKKFHEFSSDSDY